MTNIVECTGYLSVHMHNMAWLLKWLTLEGDLKHFALESLLHMQSNFK